MVRSLLARIGISRSRESRSTLQQPSSWLGDALGAGPTVAGVAISERNALGIAAVWAAVRVLSESVAALPLVVYRRDGRARERAGEHPLYSILHDAPNPDMSSYQFRETLQAHCCLWGNAYAEIVRDGGVVAALWPIQPERVEVRLRSDGRPLYLVDGRRAIEASDMLHFAGISHDGLVGHSPIRWARESLGLAAAAEQHGASVFGNGATPGGVLEHPGVMSDEAIERLRESWESMHRGARRAHRVAILEQGMKWSAMSMPNDDAQWLQTRQFQITEIARWFRLPPHMIGDLSRSSFSNIESQQLSFYRDSLLPHLVRWEQEIRRKLFARDEAYAEFVVDGLLRADTATRFQAYSLGRSGGWLSINDIRERENLNPIVGGDDYLTPLNMQAVGPNLTAPEGQMAPSPAAAAEALEPDALERAARLSRETGAPVEQILALVRGAPTPAAVPDQRLLDRIDTLEQRLSQQSESDRAFAAAVERLIRG